MKYDAIHVKLHDNFQGYLSVRPAQAFCPGPLHPNMAGYMIIVESLLKALGWSVQNRRCDYFMPTSEKKALTVLAG